MAAGIGPSISRAAAGLTWQYPCILWACDFVRDMGFEYPGARWDGIERNERNSRFELAKARKQVEGTTSVECIFQVLANDYGWQRSGDKPPFIGVYNIDEEGYPALSEDGQLWLFAGLGNATFTRRKPCVFWSLR